MKFPNAAIARITSDVETNVENTTACDAPKLNETLENTNDPITMRPLYRALKGYSLYKQEAKLQAIVDFLQLSSYTSLLISQDPDLCSQLSSICEGPANVLKGMKSASKWPSKWTTSFCAQFIIEVVEILERDRKLYQSLATRKSNRKSLKDALPPSASKLVSMVEKARAKIQVDLYTSGSTVYGRKRKAATKQSVGDFLLKGAPDYNPNFVEVTSDKVESHLLCPLCNHRSLVSITSKEQVDTRNERIQESFEKKMDVWNSDSRDGRKPRMENTHTAK